MWQFLYQNWLGVAIFALVLVLAFKTLRSVFHFWAATNSTNRLVYMKVRLPKNDSTGQNSAHQEQEKDFRERIGIMSQLFRSLSEIRELTLKNRIRVWLFQLDVVSFEIRCTGKNVYFYVVTYDEYRDLIQKQITSYYPDADIAVEEAYQLEKPGYATRAYYAYQSRESFYPIKDYKVVESDPLNTLTNVFSKFQDDDEAVIQVVVRPCGSKWQKKAREFGEKIYKGKSPESKGFISRIPGLSTVSFLFRAMIFGYDKAKVGDEPEQDNGFVRILQTKEELSKRIGEKADQPGFDTVIRIFVTSKTPDRADSIISDTFISFNVFRDDAGNRFQTRRIIPINFLNNRILIHNFKNRYFKLSEKSSLLVPSELASIFHFPDSKYNKSPVISWLDYRVLPAPVDVPKEGIFLGNNLYRGQTTPIRMLRDDRTRHFYIIGKSGSGKSVFLNSMAKQDIINGDGVCVIDPHGDLIEDLLMYVPKERVKDVIVFDPADQERPMGLNMLEAKDTTEMDLVSSQATEIFIKLFGDEIFGPRIQHYFRNACLTLMEDTEEGATLIDVPRMFTDDTFMKYKVSKAKNPVVRSFWEHEYANTGDRERQEMIPYFSAKFGPFITNSVIRNVIGQSKSAFNLREVMDQQKILLINLSKGKIGDLNTQLLGLVLVAKIQMAAMSRTDIPKDQRKDFYLYVDEFQNFATDSFATILSEARKYRLNLIMAHQYINQLVTSRYGSTSSQVRDAVFGNVGSMMSFKVGAEDAEYLAKEYAPDLEQQDILGIANYKAYLRLNINNTTSRPFSLETVYDRTGESDKVAKVVKEYSRIKYGRKFEFVNKEIGTRIGYDFDEVANQQVEQPPAKQAEEAKADDEAAEKLTS